MCYLFLLSEGQTRTTASLTKCAAAAFVLVLLLFADVLFRGASLAPLDYDIALSPDHAPSAPVSLYPEIAGRQITDSWGDIGAASWQFEPAVRWMAHCLRSGESPWWNPYDAAGRMGPESLVDVPFSGVTLAAALFGGSSTAISFVLVALYFVTAFSLIRALNQFLGVSFPASCGAAAVYLLSGFALANLNTQIGQPYFVSPLVLLSLLALLQRPTAVRFALASLAHTLLFTITFFPTMVLATISLHCIAIAYSQGGLASPRNRINLAALQCAVPLLGFFLVAFLYLPIFEATFNYINIGASYAQRQTPGYSLESALSLFTPKHFWQSYRAGTRSGPGGQMVIVEAWVFHIGVIASLLAAAGFARYPERRTTLISLVSGLLVAITIGQLFGIPPFTLIDRLPFFSFVRNEYWPVLAGLPIAVLVAFGLDHIGKWGDVSVGIAAACIASCFVYLLMKMHWPTDALEQRQVFVFAVVFLLGLTLVLMCQLRLPGWRQLRVALALGCLVEGIYYMNSLHPVRSHRDEQLPESLGWVARQVSAPGGNRILNFGASGIMPNWAGGIQVPDVGAMEISILPQYQNFFNQQVGTNLFLSFYDQAGTLRFTRASLSALGVRFVVVDRAFSGAVARLNEIGLKEVHHDNVRLIFENPNPLPRAFFAAKLVPSASLPWEIAAAPERAVTTQEERLLRTAKETGSAAGSGTVAVEEYHNTKIRIRTDNRVPALLVLMDSWHPNWKATIDGVDAYVGLVDSAFRGVSVPPGSHMVEFRYQPKTLTAGTSISVAALVFVLALLLFEQVKRWKRYLISL